MGNELIMPAYAEALRRALSMGLRELDSTIVRLPGEAGCRHAVVLATVRANDGVVLRAVGEANADGDSGDDARFLVTLAESRAKGRVLSELMCLAISGAEASEGRAAGGRDELPRFTDGAADVRSETGDHSKASLAEAVTDAGDHQLDTSPLSPVASHTAGERVPVMETGEPPPARAKQAASEHSSRLEDRSTGFSSSQKPDPGSQRGLLSVDVAIGPDVVARLLQLTRRKAEAEGAPICEEEAMLRIDSYFQRAFGHPVAEGTQIEGQRVVQRLMSGTGRAPVNRSPATRR
jgi:hypothetical protein